MVALAAGFGWGLVNGFLVAKGKIPPLIVTLGTLGMSLGAALVITGGVDEREVPFKLITTIGIGRAFNQIPWLVIIAFAVALVFGVILAGTRFGRYTYAVGSNEEAARRAGIPVDFHLMKVYALTGTLSGLAGFLSLARFSTTTIGAHDTDNLSGDRRRRHRRHEPVRGHRDDARNRLRRVHPGCPRQRLHHRRSPGVLAADRRRRCAHRRRLPRPIAPPVAGPAVTVTTNTRRRRSVPTMARRTWFAAACAAILALAVAACGSDNNSSTSTSGGGASTTAAKKNYKMTLIAGVKGDEFYITMNCGAQAKAKELGVTLDFQGPDKFDASLQTPVVNAVAAKKPDAVLVAPTDTKAMFAPIQQMSQNGTKIVLVDTTLDQPDMAVSQIASDNEAGGKAAATALAKLIGGKGKVFVVNVKPGISTTDARGKGFEDGAKALGLTYVGQEYDDDDAAKAAAVTKAALAKNPDLKGIFATNLFSAEGAATGIREAGKVGQVKIVGFDAGPKQVQELKDGVVQGLIAQKPADIGAQGVQQAYNALTGKATTKMIGTGSVAITKANLDQNQDALYKSNC